jgi:uncharacterized membrane protein
MALSVKQKYQGCLTVVVIGLIVVLYSLTRIAAFASSDQNKHWLALLVVTALISVLAALVMRFYRAALQNENDRAVKVETLANFAKDIGQAKEKK